MTEETNQAIENNEVVSEPIIENEVEETPPVEDSREDEEFKEVGEESEKDGEKEASDSDDEHDEKFPKKAERALERRNKKINKLRAREAELLARQAELERKLEAYAANPEPQDRQALDDFKPEGLVEPREDDFEDYATYLKALGKYEQKYEDSKNRAMQEAEAQQQEFQRSQQQWVQERAKYVDDRAAKAVETIPELDGLYKENQDIIEGYSDSIKYAFLEAEKPELAFYALAKEGRLEELEGMSPMGVARELALAEIRGEKLVKTRPVSKAPAPIKPRKGTATRKKSLADMSPSELIAYSKKIKGY